MSARAEVAVGMSSCGIAAGARTVFEALTKDVAEKKLAWEVTSTGCIGACHAEPMIEVRQSDGRAFLYGNVDEANSRRIVESHLVGGTPVAELLIAPTDPYLAKQKRIVLANCGVIDPESIDQYIAHGGYEALKKVLSSMSPEAVIEEVKASGLRGRGGAGFPTWQKWSFARQAVSTTGRKYVICNADEGDPGAFMNRSVLEGDPHAVLEGMLICAFAIGADEGYIYVRAEYPLAIKRLEIAVKAMEERTLLGTGILGSGFSFDLEVRVGAGAFVCGEETALIASIEGRRGEPKPRPPFPAVKGVWGKPTNNNNVETYAVVPQIILKGADWYASMGTEKSKGTKTFAIGGDVNNAGLIEVPIGMSIREVVYDVAGGIRDGKDFKAVQIGGPMGGCLTKDHLDLPIDYESLTAAGAMMGSGGLVVMDDETCMVDIARFFMEFTQDESCGKCTPCRVGTKRMLEILQRICNGEGKDGDIEQLEYLSKQIIKTSLCGLGQGAPNPVISTLKLFRHEYEAHIYEKRCPAKVCRSLIHYQIESNCTGCMVCARNCPVEAITGQRRSVHVIDPNTCIKCGICMQVCNFNAVAVTS